MNETRNETWPMLQIKKTKNQTSVVINMQMKAQNETQPILQTRKAQNEM